MDDYYIIRNDRAPAQTYFYVLETLICAFCLPFSVAVQVRMYTTLNRLNKPKVELVFLTSFT